MKSKFFKKPKKRKPLAILGSILVGLLSGFLLSWLIVAFFNIQSFWRYLIIVPLALFNGYQGWKHYKATYYWAFVVAIASLFITIGNAFGGGFMSLTSEEKWIFFSAWGLIFLNVITGNIKIRLNQAKKVTLRTIGKE